MNTLVFKCSIVVGGDDANLVAQVSKGVVDGCSGEKKNFGVLVLLDHLTEQALVTCEAFFFFDAVSEVVGFVDDDEVEFPPVETGKVESTA